MSVMEHGVLTEDRKYNWAGMTPVVTFAARGRTGLYVPPMFGWAFGPVTLCPDCNPEG